MKTKKILFITAALLIVVLVAPTFSIADFFVIPTNTGGNAEGDATATDVLAGKTFSNTNSIAITGTMENNGAITISPDSTAQVIPEGYHNGFGTVGACNTYTDDRFTDNTNGTVTDNLTSLIWLKDANCTVFFAGDATGQNNRLWDDAELATSLLAHGFCNLTDNSEVGNWRLPTIKELHSLVDYSYIEPALSNTIGNGQWTESNAFSGVQSSFYWSSSLFANEPSKVWRMSLIHGGVLYGDKTNDNFYVWPVRDGQ